MANTDDSGTVSPAATLMTNLLDCVGSPVFVKDRKHRFIYLNKAAQEFLGYAGKKMLGKTDADFFPEDQVRAFWETDDEVLRTGLESVREELLTDAKGKRHVIVTRKLLLSADNGEKALVGVINDISELKRVNNELAVFRKLLENSNDAIFIINPRDGTFVDVNETACRSLGYGRETLLRMGVPDIKSPLAGPSEWKMIRDRLKEGDRVVFESMHLRADGTSFPVEVSVNFTEADGISYLLATSRDISERKQMQEAMKELDALRGLIPICAKCKNIRDDKGFWQDVETYLEKHSKAKFTHGLCKKCMEELYGKESWFREDGK